MDPHDDKNLPPASSTSTRPSEPEPFRLLDLPAEIRLMIYGYAIEYRNVCWTMSHQDKVYFLLRLGDIHDANEKSSLGLCHRPISLLQTCRSFSQEAHPILFNQTRFDIRCRAHTPLDLAKYHLRITLPWHPESVPSMAQVVLSRIKHIRYLFDSTGRGFLFWHHYLLRSKYLDFGRQLRSLRLTFGGRNFMDFLLAKTEYTDFACLRWYHGNTLLDFCDSDFTDDDIIRFKEYLGVSKHQLPIRMIKRSDTSSHKKDWWAELAN